MACVHNMASVGDCEVPLKAGKILKIESKWKTYFGWWLFWTSSFSISHNSLLLLPDSHVSLSEVPLWVIYSIFFLLGCFGCSLLRTAAVVVGWDRRNICHWSRGAKTLDSTLSPGSGIHTIWLFPSQLLNRWLAWFLSAAALLTLRAKKRWQHGGIRLLAFLGGQNNMQSTKSTVTGIRSQSSWLGELCLSSQFRYSLVV